MNNPRIEEIQDHILEAIKNTDALEDLSVLTTNEKTALKALTSSSKVSVWRLWVYVVAFVQKAFEDTLNLFKMEIENKIAQTRPHTLQWYRRRALDFQYGCALKPETDQYDNTLLKSQDLQRAKIVHYAATQEKNGRLIIKLAKANFKKLEPTEMEAFKQYMSMIKDAGTYISYISRDPDKLKLQLDIYYDPLLMDHQGKLHDGSNAKGVLNAIDSYFEGLSFNGELVLTHLTNHLQKVKGVEIPVIKHAEARYGSLPWKETGEIYKPDAGYMRLDVEASNITYIPRL